MDSLSDNGKKMNLLLPVIAASAVVVCAVFFFDVTESQKEISHTPKSESVFIWSSHISYDSLRGYISEVKAMPATKHTKAFLLEVDDALADDKVTRAEYSKIASRYNDITDAAEVEATKRLLDGAK